MEITDELKQRFTEASTKARETPPRTLTNDEKLKLYGLFKQSEVGPCNTDRPGIFDQAGRYKHDAWTALGNLGQAEAMDQYIALVNELYTA